MRKLRKLILTVLSLIVGLGAMGWTAEPVQAAGGGTEIVAVYANSSGNPIVLDSEGYLYGVGYGFGSSYGINKTYKARAGQSAPLDMLPLTNTGKVFINNDFFEAVHNDGTVSSWSKGTYASPTRVTDLPPVEEIAIGTNFRVYLTSNGRVYTAGTDNSKGQLGVGDKNTRTSPTDIGLEDIVKVAASGYYGMALSSSGILYGWGEDGNGQFGTGTGKIQYLSPTIIGGIPDKIVNIDVGSYMVLAITNFGDLYGWGTSTHLNLAGLTSPTTYLSPTKLSVPEGVLDTSITTGLKNYILLNNGKVYTWGYGKALAEVTELGEISRIYKSGNGVVFQGINKEFYLSGETPFKGDNTVVPFTSFDFSSMIKTAKLGNIEEAREGSVVEFGDKKWLLVDDNYLLLYSPISATQFDSLNDINAEFYSKDRTTSLAHNLNTTFLDTFSESAKQSIVNHLWETQIWTGNKTTTQDTLDDKGLAPVTTIAKIGLMSIEEAFETGAPLGNGSQRIWLRNSNGSGSLEAYALDLNGDIKSWSVNSWVPAPLPSIHLDPNVMISEGDGSFYSPYKVLNLGETPPVPTTPTGLAASNVTHNSAIISWSPVGAASSYELSQNGTIVYSGPGTSFSAIGLLSQSSYIYSLRAINGSGGSTPTTLTVTTTVEPLVPPASLTIQSMSTNHLLLNWSAVSGGTGYNLYRDDVLVYSGTDLFFMDTGVVPGTSYVYKVSASNSVGESAFTSINASTAILPLTPPTNFRHSGLESDKVTLAWDAVVGATGYELYRNGELVYAGAALSFSDVGLASETSYNYTVRAMGVAPASAFDTLLVTTLDYVAPDMKPKLPSTAPGQSVIQAVYSSTDTIKIVWPPFPDGKSYTVMRGTEVVYSGTDLEFTDTGLTPDTQYTYYVFSTNAEGESPRTSIDVRTKGFPPQAISDLKLTRIYHDGAAFQWSAIPGVSDYTLIRDNSVTVYKGVLTTFRDITLDKLSTYTYKVQASNEWGTSESNSITITTVDEPSPIIISPAPPSEVTSGSITFSFKVIEGAYMHYVERNPRRVYVTNGDGTYDEFQEDSTTGNSVFLRTITPIGGKLSFKEDGVLPGVNHHYDITAFRLAASGVLEPIGGSEVDITTPSDGSGTTPSAGDVNGGNNGFDPSTPGNGTPGGGTPGGGNPGGGGGGGFGGGGSAPTPTDGTDKSDNIGPKEGNDLPVRTIDDLLSGEKIKLEDLQSGDLSWVKEKVQACKRPEVAINFNDLESHWAKEYITSLAFKGIVSGYPDGTFNANKSITRAEFVSMLVRSLCLENVTGATSNFPDVTSDAWYYNSVSLATTLGLVVGYDDGNFKPNQTITRQEIAGVLSRLLWRSESIPALSVEAVEEILGRYEDYKSISEWATASVASLASNNVMSGKTKTSISPKAHSTRAEVVTLIFKSLGIISEVK